MTPISALHQLELTSHCNLKCRYCAHPKMPRPKIDMDERTFDKALEWAQYFVKAGTQRELNLAGIGESTMHPKFIEFLAEARFRLGWNVEITMATNGVLMTEKLAAEMAAFKPRVWVSLHRPERAGPAVEALKAAGILSGVSADPSLAATDWAGQVKWHVSHPAKMQCAWVTTGRAFVMADGRIATCCLDGQGTDGVVGTVWEDVTHMHLAPYSLCKTCSYVIPEAKREVA